jgi:thiol:disulfide interchange protein DsbG
MLGQSRNHLGMLLFLVVLAGSPAVQAESLSASRIKADHLLEGIDQATWITEGKGKRVIYIFFDPDCPYCHKLYESLSPLVDGHDLQLRWIPVAMLTSTSEGKAAAILQASNPLETFRKNEDDFGLNDSGPGGGITPASAITDKTSLELISNLSLLQEQNLFTVPVVVFRAKDGQGFMFNGAPPDKTLRQLLQYVK